MILYFVPFKSHCNIGEHGVGLVKRNLKLLIVRFRKEWHETVIIADTNLSNILGKLISCNNDAISKRIDP